MNDYYIFQLIPFYYLCCLFGPGLLYGITSWLFDYVHKEKGVSPVMRTLVIPVEISLIIGMFRYCQWLEAGKAFVLSLVILAFT